MKRLEISELKKIQSLGRIEVVTKQIIEILLSAINDWPSPIIKLEDYEETVSLFVGGEVTEDKLEKCLSKINYSQSAWESESLCQLIEVFKFYDNGLSLKEIIVDLSRKLETLLLE